MYVALTQSNMALQVIYAARLICKRCRTCRNPGLSVCTQVLYLFLRDEHTHFILTSTLRQEAKTRCFKDNRNKKRRNSLESEMLYIFSCLAACFLYMCAQDVRLLYIYIIHNFHNKLKIPNYLFHILLNVSVAVMRPYL